MGWTNTTYGKVILFANENGKGMYMIAHLNDDDVPGIQAGVSVSPGQAVAYVGGSAYEGGKKPDYWAYHLHVSYYDVQYDEASDDKYIGKTNEDLIQFRQIVGYNRESERNPFWHASGRCMENNATNR
jgi:murein DD-endopeptidase MepM/ murein hydrolase activator NlpD